MKLQSINIQVDYLLKFSKAENCLCLCLRKQTQGKAPWKRSGQHKSLPVSPVSPSLELNRA